MTACRRSNTKPSASEFKTRILGNRNQIVDEPRLLQFASAHAEMGHGLEKIRKPFEVVQWYEWLKYMAVALGLPFESRVARLTRLARYEYTGKRVLLRLLSVALHEPNRVVKKVLHRFIRQETKWVPFGQRSSHVLRIMIGDVMPHQTTFACGRVLKAYVAKHQIASVGANALNRSKIRAAGSPDMLLRQPLNGNPMLARVVLRP